MSEIGVCGMCGGFLVAWCTNCEAQVDEDARDLAQPAEPSQPGTATEDLGLVGSSKIPWSSVEGAPQPLAQPVPPTEPPMIIQGEGQLLTAFKPVAAAPQEQAGTFDARALQHVRDAINAMDRETYPLNASVLFAKVRAYLGFAEMELVAAGPLHGEEIRKARGRLP